MRGRRAHRAVQNATEGRGAASTNSLQLARALLDEIEEAARDDKATSVDVIEFVQACALVSIAESLFVIARRR